jgi:hypothetical protein
MTSIVSWRYATIGFAFMCVFQFKGSLSSKTKENLVWRPHPSIHPATCLWPRISDCTLCQIFMKFCIGVFPKAVEQGWDSWRLSQWQSYINSQFIFCGPMLIILVFSCFHVRYSSVWCVDSLSFFEKPWTEFSVFMSFADWRLLYYRWWQHLSCQVVWTCGQWLEWRIQLRIQAK